MLTMNELRAASAQNLVRLRAAAHSAGIDSDDVMEIQCQAHSAGLDDLYTAALYWPASARQSTPQTFPGAERQAWIAANNAHVRVSRALERIAD